MDDFKVSWQTTLSSIMYEIWIERDDSMLNWLDLIIHMLITVGYIFHWLYNIIYWWNCTCWWYGQTQVQDESKIIASVSNIYCN